MSVCSRLSVVCVFYVIYGVVLHDFYVSCACVNVLFVCLVRLRVLFVICCVMFYGVFGFVVFVLVFCVCVCCVWCIVRCCMDCCLFCVGLLLICLCGVSIIYYALSYGLCLCCCVCVRVR